MAVDLEFLESPRFNAGSIRYGTSGGPGFRTDVATMHNGAEQRNANWEDTKGRWTIGIDLYSKVETDALAAFFRQRKGRAGAFRFKDWSDWLVPRTRGALIPVPSNPALMQLAVKYQSGIEATYRVISKPVPGSVYIYESIGGAAASMDIDYTTGLVILPETEYAGAYEWEGQFDVPVRFNADTFSISFEAYRELDGESLYSIGGLGVVEIPIHPIRIDGVVQTPAVITPTDPIVNPTNPETGVPSPAGTGPSVDSASGSAGPAGQTAGDYTLTFSDEFSSGALKSKWTNHIWYQAADPVANYAVNSGSLKIWPEANFADRTIDTDPAQNANGFTQKYGFFEIEAKLPTGKGAWPGFWLHNHIGDRRPHIVIMEAFCGGVVTGWADETFTPTAYASKVWGDQSQLLGQFKKTSATLASAFHKYGMKWEPGLISFFFDGAKISEFPVSIADPLYIVLDLWFGDLSGAPNLTDTPTGMANSFDIKYVRAWQFV